MKNLILFFVSTATIFSCTSNYRRGERLFLEGQYEESKILLFSVPENDEDYDAAILLIGSIDSIRNYNYRHNFIRDSIEISKKGDSLEQIRRIEEDTRRLERIEALKNDIPRYSETLDSISQLNSYTTDDLLKKSKLLTLIAFRCNAGLRLDNPEINKTAKECQKKLLKTQLEEFPKMRGRLASILRGELEDFDIWVKCEDLNNKTLILIGDYLVFEHRIPEMHKSIEPILKELRFDYVSYRWSNEYVNGQRYSVNSKDDSWLCLP